MTLFTRAKPIARAHSETAFPIRPIFILALCRICEPIAFMSIFPYIYYMVKSFNITDDEKTISIYAGLVTSAYAIAEFSASIFWGWLSDRIGRKPVLLTGLAGTGISMLVFGFAKSLPVALLARTVGGLLNGNIGVIITTVGEVVTEEAHQSRAFAVMPFVWSIGSIIGASLGGTLADPARNYPGTFLDVGLFRQYPFLLPNLVCTVIVVFSVTIGFLFLEETHQDLRSRGDVGLGLGRRLLGSLPAVFSRASYPEDEDVFGAADEKVEFPCTPSSPKVLPATPLLEEHSDFISEEQIISEPKVSLRSSITRQIKLLITSYALLAMHTICLEQLLPILFASSKSGTSPVFPFKFDGGFGLSAKTIGLVLSLQGAIQMVAQMIVFPIVSERLGSLATLRLAVLSYPALYLIIPYLALVPQTWRFPCITLVLVWKVTAQAFSFPSQSIILANSAPSKRVLGTLNGITMSAASLSRAIGPTLIGIVHALGRQAGYSILSWWTCAIFAIMGAVVSLLMTEPERSKSAVAVQVTDDIEKSEAQPLLVRISEDLDFASEQDSGTSSGPP